MEHDAPETVNVAGRREVGFEVDHVFKERGQELSSTPSHRPAHS